MAAVVVLALLVPGWFWLRHSSLVRVNDVTISGVSGPQAAQVRQALTDAAERMSTLDVQPGKLTDAVRQFPIVAGLTVHAHPLHKLDVIVEQRLPVGALTSGGRRVAVAGDGTILEGTATRGLPAVPVKSPPGGRTLVERDALLMVSMLGAAPRALLGRIDRVSYGDHGLAAEISDGPDLYFGPAARLQAKWAAAARVLADPSSRGATYLDLGVPERPAAGGLEPTDTGADAVTAATESQPEVQTSQ